MKYLSSAFLHSTALKYFCLQTWVFEVALALTTVWMQASITHFTAFSFSPVAIYNHLYNTTNLLAASKKTLMEIKKNLTEMRLEMK